MSLTNEDLLAIAGLLQPLKNDIQNMHMRIINIELTLENETNRNIQLLAENHITLIDKLNQ